jgi:hypothetical protein
MNWQMLWSGLALWLFYNPMMARGVTGADCFDARVLAIPSLGSPYACFDMPITTASPLLELVCYVSGPPLAVLAIGTLLGWATRGFSKVGQN